MSVVRSPLPSNLVAIYQVGESGGVPVMRQKTFANIKADASDQDVYDVAVAFFGLLQYDLQDVRRDDRSLLINED